MSTAQDADLTFGSTMIDMSAFADDICLNQSCCLIGRTGRQSPPHPAGTASALPIARPYLLGPAGSCL